VTVYLATWLPWLSGYLFVTIYLATWLPWLSLAIWLPGYLAIWLSDCLALSGTVWHCLALWLSTFLAYGLIVLLGIKPSVNLICNSSNCLINQSDAKCEC